MLESSLYMRNQLLRDTDWASMAHSLEVRVPLVDSKLLSQLATITGENGSRSKHLLANSPRVPLPPRSSNVLRLALQPRSNRGCSGTIASRSGDEFLRLPPINVRGRDGGRSRYRAPERERDGGIWVADSRAGHRCFRRAWRDRAI